MNAVRKILDEPYGALRLALGADAAVTGANGVAYLAGAGLLDGPLGVEASTLRAIGAFLIVFAGGVALAASAARPSASAVAAIVTGNAAWVVASFTVLVTGALEPGHTTGGGIWIALQAFVVGGFAAAQALAYRHATGRLDIRTS